MRGLFVIAFSLWGLAAFAQEEEVDKCAFPTDKKIIKYLEQANDSKKAPKDQYAALKEALKLDEECAECMYQLGVRAFNNAAERGSSYEYAFSYFQNLINLCPQYHADAYYYLGVIAFSEKNNPEAIKNFNLFLNFKGKPEAFAPDHKKKKDDVSEILPEIEFEETFYKNEVPFNPEPVKNVSGPQDEYLPMLSPDNEIIFFTRKVDKANLGDIKSNIQEEFTMSIRPDIAADFDKGTALPKPFNTGPNFGGSTISLDNKELIICSCKDEQGTGLGEVYKNCDLFSAKYELVTDMNTGKKKYRWSDLVNLGPNINTKNGWEAQPTLSADGKTLFFARIGEFTKSIDIYYSTKDANGNWTLAKDAGPVINTERADKTPFLHTDSRTLYFTSEVGPGRPGAGGYDIFYSRQDEKGNWSTPKNLGHPINTPADEHGLIVSTDGRMAYFASGRLKGVGGLDIFRFELYPEARPDRMTIFKGKVETVPGVDLSNVKVEIKEKGSDKVTEAVVDPENGNIVAVINTKNEKDVAITVKGKDENTKIYDSFLVKADELKEPAVKNKELKVHEIKKGASYTINDILFATDSYELTDESKFSLDQFIDYLKSIPSVKVEIQGHTDNVGNPAENLELSEKRAKSVREYIQSKGIAASRLTSHGYGETKPKVPNTSDANKALNRRTEFMITDM